MFTITIQSEEIHIPSSFKGYRIIKKNWWRHFWFFKVTKDETNDIFAAKVIYMKENGQNNERKKILNEINILSILNHPNIIKFYDAFEISNDHNKKLFIIIQEFCSRGSLLTFINDGGLRNRTKNENNKMMRNIIEAVSYLHKMKIAHCDIKCENFLVDENYNIKLIDFGLSLNFNGEYTKKRAGSFAYVAPELFITENIDFFKAEVWPVGVVLYAMSEKHLPYEDFRVLFLGKLTIKMKNKNWKKLLKNV